MLNRFVYQIYPKSFKDTNDDGIGDIKGIIEKLDYLQDLGINMIWTTPVFVSPQNDNGYDVADYRNIDPLFGTMDDVDLLIEEASKRGIDIMFDFVLNHTSTAHEWFQKALKGDKKYMDYYFFKEKPTNWQSKFGGSAWKYVESLDLYYLHLFDPTQADLNWENPEVFEELCGVVNFWLEKGITGLRFDVINLVSKPDVFEDDDVWDGRRFYTDGPRVHEHLHALNTHTFGTYEDILTVGELSSTTIDHAVKYADPTRHELGTVFGFHHLKVDYKNNRKWELKDPDFVQFKTLLAEWQLEMQAHNAYMALFLNNHDQPRANSRFGDDLNYPFESATLYSTLMFLMRGIPYIYQGEEIGLPNAYFNTIDDYRDIESLNMYRELIQTQDEKTVLDILNKRSRDNGRTPMPWNHDQFYGFSTQNPWLGFTKHPQLKTVEDNLKDPASVYHYMKRLIALRKSSQILKEGSIHFSELNHPTRFIYSRMLSDETIDVVGNMSNTTDTLDFDATGASIILSNTGRTELSNTLVLQPFEVLVVHKKNVAL